MKKMSPFKKMKPTIQPISFKPLYTHLKLDTDGDGVMDWKDCQPFNKHKQHDDLDSYTINGVVTLYHYSSTDQPILTIDPQMFSNSSTRNSYSLNDYQISSIARAFFYLDLNRVEDRMKHKTLYITSIPRAFLYDLSNDKNSYVEQVAHPEYGLRKGIEWNQLLGLLSQKYKGIYYKLGVIPIVVLFTPIQARRYEA